MATEISTLLATAIQDGTFPDSEDLLRSDISSSSIPTFLESLQASHKELDISVKKISNDVAANVDSWISQAARVQDDLIRCKEEAAQIVQDHENVLALRAVRDDARNKLGLLQEEVAFNEILERQIRLISNTFETLNLLDDDIRHGKLVSATETVTSLRAIIESISSMQSRSLLSRLESDLRQSLQKRLETELDGRCHIQVEETSILIHFSELDSTSTDTINNDQSSSSPNHLSSDAILGCLEKLNVLEEAGMRITKKVEKSLLPYIRQQSKSKILGKGSSSRELQLNLTREKIQPIDLCSTFGMLFRYLDRYTPQRLRERLLSSLATQIVPILVVDWLDTAVPTELDAVKKLDKLQVEVKSLAAVLKESGVQQSGDLEAWINQLPRTWAFRRRMGSLNAVRMAFQKSTGSMRQAERVEKQTVAVEPENAKADRVNDDWAENWDDEENESNDSSKVQDSTEDDSDAWGFDTEEQDVKTDESVKQKVLEENEDVGEAWGWEDEDDSTTKVATESRRNQQASTSNGIQERIARSEEEAAVLTEHYTVTDIPDYILDQISKDTTDLQALQDSPSTFFKFSTTTSTGVSPQSLPILILAMFRAIAPLHYQNSSLSSMNLYNDTLYLTDKLSSFAATTPILKSSLESDITTLTKFARATYTSELTLQRTILYDLLDSAQGFVSCTRPPYAQVCEDAIASVTDYLRSLHRQWQPILSPSHLHQAIGSLLSGIMAKMITDMEDMEDISEPESQKLVSFCERVTTLQDLFVVSNANANNNNIAVTAAALGNNSTSTMMTNRAGNGDKEGREDEEPASQIALYVPAYLRFAYFQQILGGSLADIRYFWEEGGLSLEFTPDEVVDLIEALFAQSVHRKNAIKAIRG